MAFYQTREMQALAMAKRKRYHTGLPLGLLSGDPVPAITPTAEIK